MLFPMIIYSNFSGILLRISSGIFHRLISILTLSNMLDGLLFIKMTAAKTLMVSEK